MRRENPRWEYRRETSAYDKSDYRSKFYKGKWEKAWIKNRIQYALDKKIDLYESMWEGYVDKTEHMPKSLFKFFPFNHNSLKCIETNSVFMNNPSNFNDPFDCLLCANENEFLKYIKNIGGQVRNRGTLIFSRAIALAVFTVLTMAGAFLFQAAANGIVFGELEWGNTKAILSYFVTELALHYALVLICMAIAIILKNNVISMVIAVCLSMNVMTIVYGVINSAIQKIGIQNFQIYKYTITGKLSLLPMNPSGNECLAAFGVAIVFIVMMISVSSVVFQKRDI